MNKVEGELAEYINNEHYKAGAVDFAEAAKNYQQTGVTSKAYDGAVQASRSGFLGNLQNSLKG